MQELQELMGLIKWWFMTPIMALVTKPDTWEDCPASVLSDWHRPGEDWFYLNFSFSYNRFLFANGTCSFFYNAGMQMILLNSDIWVFLTLWYCLTHELTRTNDLSDIKTDTEKIVERWSTRLMLSYFEIEKD